MEAGILVFDPSVDPCSVINKQCASFGRSQRWSLLEWSRINPGSFKAFFARMIQDGEFRMFYNSMYKFLILTYRRIFDVPAQGRARFEQVCVEYFSSRDKTIGLVREKN